MCHTFGDSKIRKACGVRQAWNAAVLPAFTVLDLIGYTDQVPSADCVREKPNDTDY